MRRLFATPLIALAFGLAACGGDDGAGKDDKQAYSDGVEKVSASLQKAFNEVGQGLSDSSDAKAIGARLGDGAAALDKAANDLKAIDPPGDAQQAHDKLIAGVSDFATAFRDASKDAAGGDVAQLGAQLAKLTTSEGAKKIGEAISELKAAGYDVQGSGGSQTTPAS